jgi:hypothetical protein
VWFGRNLVTFEEINCLRHQRHLIVVGVKPSGHTLIETALLLSCEIDIANWRKKITKNLKKSFVANSFLTSMIWLLHIVSFWRTWEHNIVRNAVTTTCHKSLILPQYSELPYWDLLQNRQSVSRCIRPGLVSCTDYWLSGIFCPITDKFVNFCQIISNWKMKKRLQMVTATGFSESHFSKNVSEIKIEIET